MERYPSRRFTKGLSSGLSILLLFAVGYSPSGESNTVLAADGPSTPSRPSQVEPIEVPSIFKDLPASADAITSKKAIEQSLPVVNKQPAEKPFPVDEQKGVSPVFESANFADQMRDFHATAYCLKGRTASGAYTRTGMIAADPRVLPLGTVVHIRAGRYSGTYTVTDTGAQIKGQKVDVYVSTYAEARQFGRKRIQVKVVGRAGPAR
jgi:peptidoglycan lytic transglycosylase